jgi:hypothetical protein
MPLFMDVHHKVEGATAEAVAAAHEQDLAIQDQYGVKYLKYWVDEGTGRIFCLIDAPSKEAANAVHRDGHGLCADEIFEVTEGE